MWTAAGALGCVLLLCCATTPTAANIKDERSIKRRCSGQAAATRIGRNAGAAGARVPGSQCCRRCQEAEIDIALACQVRQGHRRRQGQVTDVGNVWLTPSDIINIHDEILAMSPGLPGARSVDAVESAVDAEPCAPRRHQRCRPSPSGCSASRSSWATGSTMTTNARRSSPSMCCDLNGHEVVAAALDFADKLVGIADGKLTLVQFTGWLRDNTLRR
jgi:hypothetical protein